VDPDGYTVVLDGDAGQSIQIKGTLLLEQVTPGNHALTLIGVANNCHVSEQQPVAVVVNAGETTEASFTVACDESGRLVFSYGEPDELYMDLWVINADGSGRSRLTHGLGAHSPRWSPDGMKIAYVLEPGIGVINANGINPVIVWQAAGSVPSWSPDARRLVFSSSKDEPKGEIYSMMPDGSDVQRLTNDSEEDKDRPGPPMGAGLRSSAPAGLLATRRNSGRTSSPLVPMVRRSRA
jgi:dipeptidyl aminopeptidase/acylaminoacyl peptidase